MLTTDDMENRKRTQNISQEAHQLLKIFPPEVWSLIAKKLDTNSLICLIKSSQLFRSLLLDKRVEFLFQPVLKIMLPYLISYFGISFDDFRFSSSQYLKVKPFKSFVLTLRLGCRSWNKAIKDLASTINFDDNFTPTPIKSEIISQLFSTSYNLSSPHLSSSFLEKFTKSHATTNSNPFLSRSVTMIGLRFGNPQIFYTQIPQILHTFGPHIWKLNIRFCWDSTSELESHSATVQLISYLPNLKNFEIFFDHRSFAETLTDEENNISFANLPNLKKLVVHNWPSTSFNQFVRQNPQITLLTVFRYSNEYRYNISPLVNLEFFSTDIFCQNDQQVMFGNPQLRFPHLKRLRLYYQTSPDMQFVRWSSIFQMLSQKLQNNKQFEELNLSLPKFETEEEKMSIFEDSLNERLVLKKLKRFTAISFESKASVDFLLGVSKTLEEVTLYLELDEAEHLDDVNMHNFLVEFDSKNGKSNDHVINFVGYVSNMMQSNILDVLPALKTVRIGVNSYVKLYTRN